MDSSSLVPTDPHGFLTQPVRLLLVVPPAIIRPVTAIIRPVSAA